MPPPVRVNGEGIRRSHLTVNGEGAVSWCFTLFASGCRHSGVPISATSRGPCSVRTSGPGTHSPCGVRRPRLDKGDLEELAAGLSRVLKLSHLRALALGLGEGRCALG